MYYGICQEKRAGHPDLPGDRRARVAAGAAVRGGGRPGVRHPHRHGDRPVLEGSEKCQKRHHLHLQEDFAAGSGAAGLRHESLQRVTGGGTVTAHHRLHHRHQPDRGLRPL